VRAVLPPELVVNLETARRLGVTVHLKRDFAGQ
jgi:hypothetical protein